MSLVSHGSIANKSSDNHRRSRREGKDRRVCGCRNQELVNTLFSDAALRCWAHPVYHIQQFGYESKIISKTNGIHC